MPPRGNAQIRKHKYVKYSTGKVLKLVFASTVALVIVSIFVTYNLTTAVKSSDNPMRGKLIDDPRKLRNTKSSKDGGNNIQPVNKSANDKQQAAFVAQSNQILLQWIKERRKDQTSSSLSDLLSTPLYYSPGALPLSQLSTFQLCYTDPKVYSNHLSPGGSSRRRASYSEKHKLAYVLVPKSGSSTGRFMMKHEFEADEKFITLKPPLNVITFVREPLSRFMSQYDEAYVRTAPWQKSDNPYYWNPETKKYREHPHPFPHLFENMHSYHDYEDTFCPPSTRKFPHNRRECIDKPSAENGTLTHRLERFVSEYDGRHPFDVHLKFQVPLLSTSDGYPIYLTELHNTTNSEADWTAIAKRYFGSDHVFKNKDGVIEGRSYPRRFNSKLVSAQTQKRICELALIDYCCLNFPLPDICEEGEKKLTCKIDYDEAKKSARVQPGLFPNKEIS